MLSSYSLNYPRSPELLFSYFVWRNWKQPFYQRQCNFCLYHLFVVAVQNVHFCYYYRQSFAFIVFSQLSSFELLFSYLVWRTLKRPFYQRQLNFLLTPCFSYSSSKCWILVLLSSIFCFHRIQFKYPRSNCCLLIKWEGIESGDLLPSRQKFCLHRVLVTPVRNAVFL